MDSDGLRPTAKVKTRVPWIPPGKASTRVPAFKWEVRKIIVYQSVCFSYLLLFFFLMDAHNFNGCSAAKRTEWVFGYIIAI